MSDPKKIYYKYCMVPMCTNTTANSNEKLFFNVPKDSTIRATWTKAMKRDDKLSGKLSSKSSLWCCEDHFSLEEDMENYWQWMLTKDVKRLQLKRGIVPHRFECQKKNVPIPIERRAAKKRKNLSLIQEALSASEASTSSLSFLAESHIDDRDENMDISSSHADKSVQVDVKKPCRSKGTNTSLELTSTACSPVKVLNVKEYSLPGELIFESETQNSDDELFKVNSSESIESDAECTDSSFEEESISAERYKQHMIVGTLLSIEKDPKLFLGLPPRSFFLIKLITEQAPLPTNHVYVVLKKLRLNMPFSVMALDFGLSISTISRVFSKSVPILANLMQELIVWPNKKNICAHLPIPFRARYAKVQSIIDCLEIQIEKPCNPLHQALTWSNYYNCNTIKYLVSCTPDGLISYLSEGYGGRASDLTIVEDSGYLNKLSPGSLVMADRGFKNISSLLEQRGCSLIRPPSVSASSVSTKTEVKQAKRIAALRIHVERVIGRLREFSILSPHACVDNHFINMLDYFMIIACGMINMQDHLIKNQI